MYHLFKRKETDGVEFKYQLEKGDVTLWGKKDWKFLDHPTNEPEEIKTVVVCSSCFLKEKFGEETDTKSLRMVIQNRNFRKDLTKEAEFDVELHAIEFFILFPEKGYCPHFIVSIPLQRCSEPKIKTYEDLKGREFERRKKEGTKDESEPYTITTGWRRWDDKREFWATSGRSNDLFIWPVHWGKLMAAFGHSAEFGKIEEDKIVSQSCSLHEGEIKIPAGKNSKECQCST